MAHLGYTLVLWLALPWVLARLWWRGRREPEYRLNIRERFGFYGARPSRNAARKVLWLHAVSIGETNAAAPLVEALLERHPDYRIVVTQMTATGRKSARELFGGRAEIVYLPYDYGFAVRRFIASFQPGLGILMETEIWFNLVRECKRAGIPLLLANARMSARSARGYELVSGLSRRAFSRIDVVGAQTTEDAVRLRSLGAGRCEVTGNLKFDIVPAPATLAALLRARYGSRPVLLAASTREGEEQLLLEALAALPREVLVTVVPRHPQRFEEVMRLLEARGKCVRRSDNRPIPPDCRFVLGDSMGELAGYYAASDLAFVGGSLLPYGGQNLIEASAVGVPVLIGPHTFNFSEVAEQAIAAGAALRVASAGELVAQATHLLADPARRARMGAAGRAFCESHRGATARTLALCEQLISAR